MKRGRTIQRLKAVFLLAVFSLNIVVGFACSVGVDMGFNSHHHDEPAELYIHNNGSEHHHKKSGHTHSDHNKKDNCCNDKVLKILQTDKAVPSVAKLAPTNFDTYFIPTYYTLNISYSLQVNHINKYCLHWHHTPPIPDIRIAIQSFQI